MFSFDGQELYVGSFDKCMYSLSVSSGALNWKYCTGGEIRRAASISADGKELYFGSRGGDPLSPRRHPLPVLYMVSQTSLPFASPGKMRGLTLHRLFRRVFESEEDTTHYYYCYYYVATTIDYYSLFSITTTTTTTATRWRTFSSRPSTSTLVGGKHQLIPATSRLTWDCRVTHRGMSERASE